MLQEHVPGRLRRVDADAVVGNDRGRRGRDLELFVRVFFFSKSGFFFFLMRSRLRKKGKRKRKKTEFNSIRCPPLTSSAAYLSTAVNGAASGTLKLLFLFLDWSQERSGREGVSLKLFFLFRASFAIFLPPSSLLPPPDLENSHFVRQLGVRGQDDLEGDLAPM